MTELFGVHLAAPESLPANILFFPINIE